ncbi:hypothetical protein P5V15_011183 [Pogonomyrmex californicus]
MVNKSYFFTIYSGYPIFPDFLHFSFSVSRGLLRFPESSSRVVGIIRFKCTSPLTNTALDMVEMTAPTKSDGQTQFGNTRQLDPSDCIFVFKNTLSDYEEPLSDEEVSFTTTCEFNKVTNLFVSRKPVTSHAVGMSQSHSASCPNSTYCKKKVVFHFFFFLSCDIAE